MNDLEKKIIPEKIFETLFEFEKKFFKDQTRISQAEFQYSRENLYFELNKFYQNKKLYLLKSSGDKVCILQSMWDYGEHVVYRWLQPLGGRGSLSGEFGVMTEINNGTLDLIPNLLRNLRNALDKEQKRRKIICSSTYERKRLKTLEICKLSRYINIKEIVEKY
jgi:hypothetical protein